MRAKTTAVSAATILIVAAITLIAYTPFDGPPQVASSPSGGQAIATSCSITGAPVGGELRVLSDSGSPLAGVQVKGSSEAYCNNQPQVIALPVVTTNSSGWADLEPVYAAYNLTLTYEGRTYTISLPNQPTSATYAAFLIPSGRLTTSFCFGGSHCTLLPSSVNEIYTVNATFVSRLCTNSSAIPKTGAQAAGLQPSGSEGPIGFSLVSTGWKNFGSSPVSVEAVCIDAVGMVPAVVSEAGSTATTLRLTISPTGQIQPGQQASITASFTVGSGIYYMPQGGLGVTVIAADESSASETGPRGGGFLTTATSPSPVSSIRSVSLLGGNSPALSADLRFNSSSRPISEIDVYINGTYVGTVGVGHNSTSPNASSPYDVSYNIRIAEPSRITLVSGAAFMVTFVVATTGYFETSVSTVVTAG